MKHTLPILTLFFLFFGASPASAIGPYTDNGNGTVYDQATGLTWQQTTADVNGDNTITSGYYPTGDIATWEQALAYCEGLGNDWRLPNIRELKSLVDRTIYLPAIDSHFQCESNYYWSATTYANGAGGAWVVNFNNGYGNDYYQTDHHYVRCVRGGLSGSFGQFGSFAFAPVSSPVDTNSCQDIHVEARTPTVTLDTDFNGDAALSVNYGSVSPTSLRFVNGVARKVVDGQVRNEDPCVTIYGLGENKRLTVQGAGRYGASNYFTNGSGYCTGRVEVHANTSGATVILNKVEGGEYSRKNTNYFHVAAFNNVPCNSYTITVEKDGHSYEDNKPLNVTFIGNNYVRNIHLPASGTKTPVILIPGIMGSTNRGVSGKYPYFHGNYPDKDIVIHMPGWTGWNKLQRELKNDGHPVILCPWDWRSESRESMKKNVETFLIPAIDNALRYSTTKKVDIVSHSMGGLLARAYIQSDLYRDDVNRLALVAVPNLGSANPYCLIEAGDTKTTKALLDDDFYEETIKMLWKETYHKKNWKSCKAGKIRDFLHDYGPGVYQLMYTRDFLRKNNSGQNNPDYGVMQGDNVNTWLKAMNGGTDGFESPGSVFSRPDASGNKVKTRVFAGKLSDKKTLRWIETDGTASALYPDGTPLDYRPCSGDGNGSPSHVVWDDGDGTVPWDSAVLPVTQRWADGYSITGSSEHPFIMKDFTNAIKL